MSTLQSGICFFPSVIFSTISNRKKQYAPSISIEQKRQMQRVTVHHIDVFTTVPNTGNPAAVIIEGKDLTEQQMQVIAREVNLSETAFLLPPSKREADLRIRWFTPTAEATHLGHATVASFHALMEKGKLGMTDKGRYTFRLETMGGILPIDVHKNDRLSSV